MAVDNKVMYLLIAVIGVLVLGLGGMIPGYKFGGQGQTVIVPPSGGGSLGGGTLQTCQENTALTLKEIGQDAFNGSAVITNGETWYTDNSRETGETNVNAALTSVSTTAPQFFKGYMMIGNDNFESGTDRGAEYYYQKVPVSVNECRNSYTIPNVNMFLEGTPTWSGYDDGTLEATTNITVGSGSTVTTTELKIEAPVAQALGNPAFDRPLGVCFNVTTTATWDSVKVPESHRSGTFSRPGFLSNNQILGDCYILNTPALKDAGSYRFPIIIKAASGQNPAAGTEEIQAILVDKCNYKNDNGLWLEGWGDESEIGSDADCGMDSEIDGSVKHIWVN